MTIYGSVDPDKITLSNQGGFGGVGGVQGFGARGTDGRYGVNADPFSDHPSYDCCSGGSVTDKEGTKFTTTGPASHGNQELMVRIIPMLEEVKEEWTDHGASLITK